MRYPLGLRARPLLYQWGQVSLCRWEVRFFDHGDEFLVLRSLPCGLFLP